MKSMLSIRLPGGRKLGSRFCDFEWLPPYAPDLNPVEWCWNHAKYTDMANFVPENVGSLHDAISASVTQQSENKSHVRSFFAGVKLKL
jgi:transposase